MSDVRPSSCHRHARDRGAVYVLVLIVTSIVTGFGLLGLAVVQTQHSEGARISDSMAARHNAASALDTAIHLLNANPDWRAERDHGDWLGEVALGSGSFEIQVEAVGGGAYSVSASDPVQITGIGNSGGSRSLLRVSSTLVGSDSAEHSELLFKAGAIGYWPMAGTVAEGFERDVAGTHDIETVAADQVTPGAVPGLGSASAAWFNGDDTATVSVGQPAGAEQTRSISVWFWAEDVTDTQGIVTRLASSRRTGGNWELYLTGGQLGARYDTQVRTMDARGGVVAASQWNHAVLVVDENGLRLYLNGVPVDSWLLGGMAAELDACIPDRNIRMGVSKLTGDADDPLVGSVCELSLLRAPLTDDEVSTLFSSYAEPAQYVIVLDSWERVVE